MNIDYPRHVEIIVGNTNISAAMYRVESPQETYKIIHSRVANYIFQEADVLFKLPAFQRPLDHLSKISCNAQLLRFIFEELLNSGLSIKKLCLETNISASTVKKYLYQKTVDVRPQTFFKVIKFYIAWHQQN